ncbi:MAG: hypothetical protein K9L30_10560 [Desulfobacterales bacterium]|nr:hypothetical protein [Desulfobacterales bacterium]
MPLEFAGNLYEDLTLRWTYNSNAIEGNILTLKETKVALEGITIGGKTMKEHLRQLIIVNPSVLLKSWRKNETLSEWQIKFINF